MTRSRRQTPQNKPKLANPPAAVAIFTLALVLLIPNLHCVQASGLDTYTNETWGYSIDYPSDWVVTEIDANRTYITAPPPYTGQISIEVMENVGLPIEGEVQILLEALSVAWAKLTVLQSDEMQGDWDCYLEYDSTRLGTGEQFHGELYLKVTDGHVYTVGTVFEKAHYDVYPLSKTLLSFNLRASQTQNWDGHSQQ